MLAFACAFTMFAGAAFTDQADFDVDIDVVNTLVGLGVIDGYDDGSFRPEATVTRAEMAKMIYVIRTGRSDASAYNNDATTFTDISDHWARGYIKYCQSMGIIAGKSTTSFDPDATVTTQEAAKMLLVTLGYNAEKAGLEGTTWGQKTTALADENGLLEDVNCGTTQGMPRQYAAQLLYNAIFTPTVVYRDGEYTNLDVLGNKNPTIGVKYMDLSQHEGTLTAVSYNEDKDEFTYTVDDKNAETKDDFSTSADYTEFYQMNVNVLYKTVNGKTTVYGIYAQDSVVLVEDVIGNIDDLAKIKEGTTEKVKVDGTEYKIDADITGYYFLGAKIANLAEVTAKEGYQSFVFKGIDNGDNGKIETLVVYPVTVAKVTYAGSKSITAGAPYTFEDDNIADGIEKDDWVVITADANTPKDGADIVKAEIVSGKVTGQKNGEIQIDGTWYKTAKALTVKNGDSYDFASYNGYLFNAELVDENSTDVAFVSAVGEFESMVGESEGTVAVRAYFTDGTDKEITVSKVGGNKVTKSNVPAANKLYTYKVSGDNYELTTVDGDNKAGCDGYVADAEYDNKKIGGKSIADDAVVFVKDKNGVKIMTGKQVADWGNVKFADGTASGDQVIDGSALYTASNGIDYVKVAALVDNTEARPNADSDTQYAYLTADAYTTTYGEDDDAVIAYSIWNGVEVTTIYEEYTGTPTLLTKGTVIRYKVDGDYVIAVSGNTIYGDQSFATLAAVTGFDYKDEGAMVYATSGTAVNNATLDEDCVFIAVDDENSAMHEGGMADIALAKSEADGKVTANAYLVINSGTVLAVIYDIPNNEIDAASNQFADA